jgi:hypothetical protein
MATDNIVRQNLRPLKQYTHVNLLGDNKEILKMKGCTKSMMAFAFY